jgi:hypothetical protein
MMQAGWSSQYESVSMMQAGWSSQYESVSMMQAGWSSQCEGAGAAEPAAFSSLRIPFRTPLGMRDAAQRGSSREEASGR